MHQRMLARITTARAAKLCVPVLVAFLLTASCAPSTTTIVPATPVATALPVIATGPVVSPYIKVMVVGVEIRFLETDPAQVELVIRGTLPDQCKYDFYSVESRAGQNVKVSLNGIHPAGRDCPRTAQDIEYVLPLGRDMPEAERGFSPGDYRLTVNNYQTSFSIKQ